MVNSSSLSSSAHQLLQLKASTEALKGSSRGTIQRTLDIFPSSKSTDFAWLHSSEDCFHAPYPQLSARLVFGHSGDSKVGIHKGTSNAIFFFLKSLDQSVSCGPSKKTTVEDKVCEKITHL